MVITVIYNDVQGFKKSMYSIVNQAWEKFLYLVISDSLSLMNYGNFNHGTVLGSY